MIVLEKSQILIEKMTLMDKLNGKVVPFTLWPAQVKFLDILHNSRRLITVKKRQVGMSLLTGADSLCHCLALPKYVVLILSKTEDDAIEYLRRVKELYQSLPDTIRKACKIVKNISTEMEFFNGARFISLPANRGAGMTADRVIIDEAGYITSTDSHISLEEVFRRVEPTLDKSEGQLIVISTANGFNLFQKYYAKAKTGLTVWRSFFFSCWDDPTFSKEKREDIIKAHDEDFANQAYPRSDIEAFLMSGRSRFNKRVLGEMMSGLELGKVGILESVNGRIVFTDNPNGWITIYQDKKAGTGYLMGCDTAEGICNADGSTNEDGSKDTDWSAGVVLDYNLNMVAKIHCKFELDVFKDEIEKLGKYYNNAFIGVERNKDGLGVLISLKKTYDNLYYQTNLDPDTHVRERCLGFKTDRVSKPLLISHCDKLIRERLVKIPDNDLLSELTTFVTYNDGHVGAQDSCHDDLVMAFAIACWIQQFAPDVVPLKILDSEDRFFDKYEFEKKEDFADMGKWR